ncbi:hypothetical protein ACFC6Z_00045, partial [Kitasatospora purpeofusca]
NYTTVCSFSPIPTGWVTTSTSATSNCAGNAYLYNIVNTAVLSYTTACPFSTIPTGWVITSRFNTSDCGGNGFGYNIRRA